MIKRYVVFGLALITTVMIATAMKEPLQSETSGSKTLYNDRGRVDHSKYLKFSHKFHVEEQGIACEDCHTAVRTSKLSSDNLLGDHASCQTCHEEQISTDCAFCHTTPDNIVPIPRPERELIFSHEAHLSQNIKCETCHAGVEAVDYVTSKPKAYEPLAQKNMPSMITCMTCHSEKNISMNCETCHTNFTSLVPEDHLVIDFRKRHKELSRIGMMEVSCATCHTSESFCQDCHTGAELTAFGLKQDLMTDPSPRGSVKDSPKQLRLQQVHSLNYRFTHGIDAKSRLIDCASCHEQQNFCATCHQAGGNITQVKIKPENHKLAGFTTIGRGSGGGLHADLARRDIENCISCHDVQGNDPTCFTCHTESGKVR